MSAPRIGVVVPAVGSRASLRRTVESLVHGTPAVAVVVGCLGDRSLADTLAAEAPGTVTVVPAPPGAARSRNVALRALVALVEVDAIMFLDDDCVVAPGGMERAALRLAQGYEAVTGRITVARGGPARQHHAAAPAEISVRNVWRYSMEAGLVVSRRLVADVGGFDESIGVGAGTPWGSGEGTDLLIRGLRRGLPMLHDPAIEIVEEGGASSVHGGDDGAKVRSYARGTGYVYRRHFGAARTTGFLVRSAARATTVTLAGRPATARQMLVGRVEGALRLPRAAG